MVLRWVAQNPCLGPSTPRHSNEGAMKPRFFAAAGSLAQLLQGYQCFG